MSTISSDVERYLEGRRLEGRLTSFDFCFNHFQGAYKAGRLAQLADADLELSCLHLGQYLASWGMYRASGQLLQRSAYAYVPLIEWIATEEHGLWGLDVDNYSEAAFDRILSAQSAVSEALGFPVTGTLATKTLLGVFGCVPAFDRFFRIGFSASGFRRKHLHRLQEFYSENADAIDAARPSTLTFSNDGSAHRYSRAKVLDMVFFVRGGGPTISPR